MEGGGVEDRSEAGDASEPESEWKNPILSAVRRL